jgi:hypothetical protein
MTAPNRLTHHILVSTAHPIKRNSSKYDRKERTTDVVFVFRSRTYEAHAMSSFCAADRLSDMANTCLLPSGKGTRSAAPAPSRNLPRYGRVAENAARHSPSASDLDELRGGGRRGEEVVEEHEGAEAEAYPPREVRLVQPGNPEGEAEDGEVDLLLLLLRRRVGAGGADAGGAWAAAAAGTGGGGEAREEAAAVAERWWRRWRAGEERHGVVGADLVGCLCVPQQDVRSPRHVLLLCC